MSMYLYMLLWLVLYLRLKHPLSNALLKNHQAAKAVSINIGATVFKLTVSRSRGPIILYHRLLKSVCEPIESRRLSKGLPLSMKLQFTIKRITTVLKKARKNTNNIIKVPSYETVLSLRLFTIRITSCLIKKLKRTIMLDANNYR